MQLPRLYLLTRNAKDDILPPPPAASTTAAKEATPDLTEDEDNPATQAVEVDDVESENNTALEEDDPEAEEAMDVDEDAPDPPDPTVNGAPTSIPQPPSPRPLRHQ